MRPLIRKERQLAIAAAAILIIAMTYNSLIAPALERMDTLHRVIPEKRQELIEVTQTAHQITRLQNQLDGLQKTLADQPSDLSPQSALTEIIQESNLTTNQKNLTQRQRPIENHYIQTTLTLELQGLTLKQLVKLLGRCQNHTPKLTLQNLTLTRNNTFLNATLTFSHLAVNPNR